MNKGLIFSCIAMTLASSLFFSCTPATEDPKPAANASRVVSGTITVTAASDWDTLKLGLFSGGDSGTYPDLDYDDSTTDSVTDYRLAYYDTGDESDVPVSRLSGAAYTITGTGVTERTYTFELPSTVPAEGVTYFYAAWLDADGDGILDLKDASAYSFPAIAAQGEFNRLANKMYDDDGTPITIMIKGFMQSRDAQLKLNGNYKYAGYDNASNNPLIDLDSDGALSGFNFHMIPNGTW